MLIVVKQIADILVFVVLLALCLFGIAYIIYAWKSSKEADRIFKEAMSEMLQHGKELAKQEQDKEKQDEVD